MWITQPKPIQNEPEQNSGIITENRTQNVKTSKTQTDTSAQRYGSGTTTALKAKNVCNYALTINARLEIFKADPTCNISSISGSIPAH